MFYEEEDEYEEIGDKEGLIQKFEECQKEAKIGFFSSEEYEYLINLFIQGQNLDSALKAVDWALEQYPHATDFMLDKSRILAFMGQTNEAMSLISKAEDFLHETEELLFSKAFVFYQQEKYTESINCCEKLLPLVEGMDEPEEQVYCILGLCYVRLGKAEQAVPFFIKVLHQNPEMEEVAEELLDCYELLGRLAEVEEFYQEFTDKNPYSVRAWHNLGRYYMRTLRFTDAYKAFEYTTLIDEENADGFFQLGNVLMNLERYEEALAQYEEALRLERSAEYYCHIGACYEQLKQYEKAISAFKKAIQYEDDYADAWYGIGTSLNSCDKCFEAIHFLQKALKHDPENGQYWAALAYSEYETGNVISSLSAYEKANDLDPQDAITLLEWANIYFEQGDYDHAAEILENGIAEVEDYGDLIYHLTAYLLLAGRHQIALRYFEKALSEFFDKHEEIFVYFPQAETRRILDKIINQYR